MQRCMANWQTAIPNELVETFRRAYKAAYGEEISIEEAREMA